MPDLVVFPLNATVTLTLPLVDYNGSAVTPTALSYTVSDEDDEVLVDGVSLMPGYTSGDATIDIVLADYINDFYGARTVELTVTTTAGVYVYESIYAITPPSRLNFLQNSFQTYAAALVTARDMIGLDGFNEAERGDRCLALIAAFDKLTKIYFVIPEPELPDQQSRLNGNCVRQIKPENWPFMTQDIWEDYPERFITALRKAQIAEANDILTGDPIADKLSSGLFSEKIGESSMMFRSGIRPLRLPVSRKAYEYLTGYIANRMVLTRS